MPWSYLESAEFDVRGRWIASLLPDISGLCLMDINCGRKPLLLNHLQETIGRYIGNDINMDPKELSDGRVFQLTAVSDDLLPELYCNEDVDMILVLGDGAGKHVEEEAESKTLADSFTALVNYHESEWIVHEAACYLDDRHAILSNRQLLLLEKGYNVHLHSQLTFGESRLCNRKLFIYRRNH